MEFTLFLGILSTIYRALEIYRQIIIKNSTKFRYMYNNIWKSLPSNQLPIFLLNYLSTMELLSLQKHDFIIELFETMRKSCQIASLWVQNEKRELRFLLTGFSKPCRRSSLTMPTTRGKFSAVQRAPSGGGTTKLSFYGPLFAMYHITLLLVLCNEQKICKFSNFRKLFAKKILTD